MKTVMIAALVAVVLVGCSTFGKIVDTAHVAAETGPAIVQDAKSLTQKVKDAVKWVKGIWTPSSPSTNAPAAK